MFSIDYLRRFCCVGLLSLLAANELQAVTITHEGESLDSGSDANFRVVNARWSSEGEADFNVSATTEKNQFIYIQDIQNSGTLQLSVPMALAGSQFKLYRVNAGQTETTDLVGEASGSSQLKHFYLNGSPSTPANYFLELTFTDEIRPSLSLDFFPDNDTELCTPLYSFSIATPALQDCKQTWSRVFYDVKVAPMLRASLLAHLRAVGEIGGNSAAMQGSH